MSDVLYVKYRPETFDDVVGQDGVVKSLSGLIQKDQSHSYLFSGPSGCGKTTLARIAAYELGCDYKDILEVDAATHTGVDAMRDIQQAVQYRPLGKSESRAVIVDECHMLSKQAWNSLLKVIEEPPSHVYFFFCTTEVVKVPQTIKTRCTSFTVKLLSFNDLLKVVEKVIDSEKLKVPNDVVKQVILKADGSPRQALVNLAMCIGAKTKKEAADILETALQSDATLELCRFLLKPGSWAKAMGIVENLVDENPEGVRILVSNYFGSVLKKATSDSQILHCLAVIEAFSQPYNPSERTTPLLRSIGMVLYGGEE